MHASVISISTAFITSTCTMRDDNDESLERIARRYCIPFAWLCLHWIALAVGVVDT
jgi:hypothetical protein